MRDLLSRRGKAGQVRRRHHRSHAADRRQLKVETLAGAQPRSAYDLDLDQLVGPAADAVHRLGAEMDAAPKFPDPEFRSACNQANVSIVASPAASTAGTQESPAPARTAGVPPLTRKQLRRRHLTAVGVLPFDSRYALGWLLRGPVATSPLFPLMLRRTLLRLGGVKLGALVYGLDRCYFGSANLSIGTGSFLNAGCWVEGAGQVEIGNDCMFGPQVMILTSTHPVGPTGEIARKSEFHGVRVEDGCWICARAMIMPGVTIGAGAIVAAGAVVTTDCEPGGLYAGVPARRVR